MLHRTSVRTMLALALAAAFLVPAASVTAVPAEAARIEPALLAKINADPQKNIDALVTLRGRVESSDVNSVKALNVRVGDVFQDFRVLYVVGKGADVKALLDLPRVRYISSNHELDAHLATATVATRVREAWDAKSTSTDPVLVGGNVVNGRGIGVAVVDSGIDATHPDLAPAVAGNNKWVCSTPFLVETASGFEKCFGNWYLQGTLNGGVYDLSCKDAGWQALSNTDSTSGHGTHVAGIVAGRGVASDGRFMGAAPGATLYGLGTGEGINVLWALEAFQWVHCNHNTVAPKIRIVTNSWGRVAPFDPADPVVMATNTLLADGLVVVFSAGNDGGTGTTDQVNMYARHPTQGVISVANYDDVDTATRTGGLDSTSSRCLSSTGAAAMAKCPDVSAPGTFITSTAAKTGAVAPPTEVSYQPYYTVLTGTSMAAPHVAGIVALLLQADPTLTAAAIEDTLEDTAFQNGGIYTMADNSNLGHNAHFGFGHGLVDAIAALEDVLGGAGLGSPLPQISQAPHVYLPNADGQVVSGVQWTVPVGQAVSISERTLVSGDPAAWPLGAATPCRFQLFTSAGLQATLPCQPAGLLVADAGLAGSWRMNVVHTFTATGEYTVESQIDYGSGYVAFDSFKIRVVSA